MIEPNWTAPSHIKAYTICRHDEATPSLPGLPFYIKQTHSAIILPAIAENRGREADASFTFEPNHICIVQTADCLPILVTNTQGSFVAAIHAGWKGLDNDIITHAFTQLAEPAADLIVWIGPAISVQYYSVGNDVRNRFIEKDPDNQTAFVSREGFWFLNMITIARLQFQKLGVSAIFGGEYCTYADPKTFFSYRRDGEQSGRMSTLIWIQPKK